MLAANIVVDAYLDANFAKDSSARNYKKRHYYYSTNIPTYNKVSLLYMLLLPKKGIFKLSPYKRSCYA
jgi:hypothetical protein